MTRKQFFKGYENPRNKYQENPFISTIILTITINK